MRLVMPSYLKPGMILSKDLYSNKNELLLSKGHTLTRREIERIQTMRQQPVYIVDHLTEDIDTQDAISQTLRNNAVQAIKEFFYHVQRNDEVMSKGTIDRAKNIVDEMVAEVIANQTATSSMTDLKLFDDYTYYHSVNVAVISIALGVAMGFGRKSLHDLGMGALLHDVGKIFVPKELLHKKETLTAEEMQELRSHSLRGSEYLRGKWGVPIVSNLAVLTHHEKQDGTGYPYGIKGNNIPQFGRVVAVADVFDALTSDRPYRKAMLPSEGVEYVLGNSGTHFDPNVVNAFLQKITPYPVGTRVVLSNGKTGIVVENRPKCGIRPKIKLEAPGAAGEAVYYDLSNDMDLLNITITGVLLS